MEENYLFPKKGRMDFRLDGVHGDRVVRSMAIDVSGVRA